jgi:UDP-N-acetylmuramoyl-L-alanyl-D-glutamate--2,6-diaminopimelate ligase
VSARRAPRPRQPIRSRLADLADLIGGRLDGLESVDPVEVTGVTASSHEVRPGDLFAALPGSSAHGIAYLEPARAAGAVAVLTDVEGAQRSGGRLPVIIAADPRAGLAPIAAAVYGNPSDRLTVTGITGTSGKTTTSFLVRAGLAAAGRPSALLGTVGTFIDDETVPAAYTTPEAPELQAILAVVAERGISHVVMEVSSHALELHRADAVAFAVGAFTNLSQDHLDFHPTMAAYFAAKARLFDGRARRAVVVVDDDWGRRLASQIGEGAVTVTTGTGRATWSAFGASTAADGSTSFRAHGPAGDYPCGSVIPGQYNDANALLALAILAELGIDPTQAAPAVRAAQVPGRMERIEAGQDFLAVVDYSHKPAAVSGALTALRPLTRGRLIIALGCGGDRDRGKRPVMGEVAARAADLLIVTDDNPRSEDPAAIRAAMLAGAFAVEAAERAEVHEVGDRAAAIADAVAAAGRGDAVLIAGKGHETGQEIAGQVYPFDDRVVLRAALRARTASA